MKTIESIATEAHRTRGEQPPAQPVEVKFVGTSNIFAPWPSIAALDLAIEVLKSQHGWQATNEFQTKWVALSEKLRASAGKFSDDELVRMWGKTAREVNQFMADHGFPEIQLDEWPASPPSFGVAAVQKIGVSWLQAGERTKLLGYDAVHIKKHAAFWGFFQSKDVVVELESANADKVFLVMEDAPLTGFELWDRAVELTGKLSNGEGRRASYSEVIFPMVSHDAWDDVSELIGLTTDDSLGTPWDLVQAKQKSRFSMNEKGAKFESGFAAQVRARGIERPPQILEINRPFVLWITRPGLPAPIMAARFCPDSWKDPGTL